MWLSISKSCLTFSYPIRHNSNFSLILIQIITSLNSLFILSLCLHISCSNYNSLSLIIIQILSFLVDHVLHENKSNFSFSFFPQSLVSSLLSSLRAESLLLTPECMKTILYGSCYIKLSFMLLWYNKSGVLNG